MLHEQWGSPQCWELNKEKHVERSLHTLLPWKLIIYYLLFLKCYFLLCGKSTIFCGFTLLKNFSPEMLKWSSNKPKLSGLSWVRKNRKFIVKSRNYFSIESGRFLDNKDNKVRNFSSRLPQLLRVLMFLMVLWWSS